jgi:hypothetical protein
LGVPNTDNAFQENWSDKFNHYFIKEFGYLQWMTECKSVHPSLELKYKGEFRKAIPIVLTKGGTVGGDIVGKSFSHCGYSLWVIAP